MAKGFDPQVLTSAVIECIEEAVSKKGNLPSTEAPAVQAKEIDEYEERMRASGIDKFNVPAYIAVVNLYLNQGDLQHHKAKGAIIVYLNTEVADKIFKALGYTIPYDEDDEAMLKLCGDFAQMVATHLKGRITSSGYAELVLSPPSMYKNTVGAGVEFSPDQNESQEVIFSYLKHKAIAVEITLAPLPRK